MSGKKQIVWFLSQPVALVALLMLAASSQAGPLGSLETSCVDEDTGFDISGRVTNSANCGIGMYHDQVNNHGPQTERVNKDSGYFNVTHWDLWSKFDADKNEWENNSPAGISFGSDVPAQFGIWTIDQSVWAEVEQLMFVFKGPGSNGRNESGLVAYLIKAGATEGQYSTPFVNEHPFEFGNGNGGDRDISHISVYQTAQVPEPSLIALLALGLLGMVALGRRRERRQPAR